MQHSLKNIITTLLVTATLGLTACSSNTADPDIKTRQDSMKSWSDATDIMDGMIEAPDMFDAEQFKSQASYLAEDAATPWTHFDNQDSIGNATEAVWTDRARFDTEAENFQKVTADLNAVAQTATSADDVQPAFSDVRASCKSCHTDFKVRN